MVLNRTMMQSINKLTDIPEKTYQGYIWYSDKKRPKIFHNERFRFSDDHLNPFVVEAMLYCHEDHSSLMVQHTGRYIISTIDFNDLPYEAVLQKKEYISHRMENVVKVCFQQLWLPEEDPNCAGMQVLTLKAIVFTGFKYENK